MLCLHIASVKAADIMTKIKNVVESYNTRGGLRKIKPHTSSSAVYVSGPGQKESMIFQSIIWKD